MPSIVVHGGAGRRVEGGEDQVSGRARGLETAAEAGAAVLRKAGSALDAVEAAIRVLEDDPQFNAGTGSVLTTEGEVEMDASVMTGDGRCGAVANLQRVRNPISVARAVMERTDHALLVGQGALRFARAIGVPDHDPITPERRARWQTVRDKIAAGDPSAFQQDELRFWTRLSGIAAEYLPIPDARKRGTVGAAARDARGGLAAGTSTGGIWFKLPGRVGDTPVFGAGTWAAAPGAASATGHGEGIIQVGLTRTAVDAMAGRSAAEGIAVALEAARVRGVECGLIAVDRDGRIGAGTTAQHMGTAQRAW